MTSIMGTVGKTNNSENRHRGKRFTHMQAAIPIAAPIVISLVIALLIYGPHLFNLTVPIEEDVRAHIFKIDILHSALSTGRVLSWLRKAMLLNKKVPLRMAVLIMEQQYQHSEATHLRIFSVLINRHGIPRSSAYRALNELEDLGMIRLNRNHGEGPVVQIRWPASAS